MKQTCKTVGMERTLGAAAPIMAIWLMRAAAGMAADAPAANLPAGPAPPRVEMRLDGLWQVAAGSLDRAPDEFTHVVPVPGFLDLAKPPFPGLIPEKGASRDYKNAKRNYDAFWYRTSFTVPQGRYGRAELLIRKAFYGVQVLVNGQPAGERPNCVTAARFDVGRWLKPAGQPNELRVRVGAWYDVLPKGVPWGADRKTLPNPPGIFDRVEIILSGSPHVVRVQVAPEPATQMARARIWLGADADAPAVVAGAVVREKKSGRVVGRASAPPADVARGQETAVDVTVPVQDCRPWSPDDPFLYVMEVSTAADTATVTFGMRSFRFDPQHVPPLLNGRPYYMRGAGIALYRFFTDEVRGVLPWDEPWIRRLFAKFKEMNWSCIRYHCCLAPELWHELADEMGFLVEEEYPGWYPEWAKTGVTAQYAEEDFRSWMQERWNHPSLVIWDAGNEDHCPVFADAAQRVRSTDISNRPWENGWLGLLAPNDVWEVHYGGGVKTMRDKSSTRQTKAGLVNEYAPTWLYRDGTITSYSVSHFKKYLPAESTVQQRFAMRAYLAARETEELRASRKYAGVLYHPGFRGQNAVALSACAFVDVPNLKMEPLFEQAMRDAFAPVGLCVSWNSQRDVALGKTASVSVIVVNDLYGPWKGTVRLRLLREQKTLWEQEQPAAVDALGTTTVSFTTTWPAEAGDYELVGELLVSDKQTIKSRRRVRVSGPN
jgi:beta-galactosidase